MNKPDWAERLQRTRKREYDKGWADCEARIIARLETAIASMKELETGYGRTSGNTAIRIQTLEVVIDIIRGEQE